MQMFSMNARRMVWLSAVLLAAALGLILWTIADGARAPERIERAVWVHAGGDA